MRDRNKEEIIQNLENENKRLKRTIATLKKKLGTYNQVDTDETIFEYLELKRNEKEESRELMRLKTKWECHDCGKGILQVKRYPVLGKKVMYYRQCTNCPKRTKAKEFSGGVQGVFPSETAEFC